MTIRLPGDVDRRADLLRQRHQHLAARRLEHQPAAGERRPRRLFTDSDARAVGRLDEAADQIVPVERAFRQRRQPLDRYPELQARERAAARVHVLDADAAPRPAVLDET